MNGFWDKVDRRNSDACWLWLAYRDTNGYGWVAHNRRKTGAHRVAWELTNGPILDGQHVLHRCDNPGCVNPDHLFLGTHGDNMADMREKLRHPYGSNCSWAKLTENDVRRIRKDGRVLREIADEFNTTAQNISLIKQRARWRHVE